MTDASRRLSIFSQRLDRAAFLAYFLGAVVPLGIFAWVTHRYLLPSYPELRTLFVTLLVSVAVLSLGSFLALRRTARGALARLDRDNRNLATLLRGSRALAASRHDQEVTQHTVACAGDLARARAAWLLVLERDGKTVRVARAAGEHTQEAFAHHRLELESLAAAALKRHRPAHDGRRGEPASILAVPCEDAPGGPGTLATLLAEPADEQERENGLALLSTLAGLAAVAWRNADLKEAQRNFFTHTTHLLVSALDAHLDFQSEHSTRVAHLSVALGRARGFEEERLQRLHFAALLHDIGMLRIDRRRLGERRVVQRHPRLGHEMLARIRLWEELAPIVLCHHEWFDGGGYPEGLVADAIPLESRIIGLAEAFDSMTNESSYRSRLDREEARQRIRDAAGSQFDPELVEAFLELEAQGAFSAPAERV